MIKLFFFGNLPLGWMRFFRTISFVWFVWSWIMAMDEWNHFGRYMGGSSDVLGWVFALLSFVVPMIFSFAISGFFVKKKD